MRIILVTLAILVGSSTDLQALLWVLAFVPAAVALTFVGFLLRPAARRRPPLEQDNSRWVGLHRATRRPTPPGRHTPARSRRHVGKSRQAELEEHTVSVDPSALWSRDGSTILGPRPERPREAPKPPPAATGLGA